MRDEEAAKIKEAQERKVSLEKDRKQKPFKLEVLLICKVPQLELRN